MLTDYDECLPDAEDGWVRVEDLPDLEHIKDHLQGMIDAIYETGDIFALEFSLDEICHQFKIPLNLKEPIIKKAEKKDYREWEKEKIEKIKKYA